LEPAFALVLRLPLLLVPAGALEPAFALDRGLKAAGAFVVELALFELEAVLALPVELDAVLALPVESDAAFALPVEAGLEEPTLWAFPVVGEGAWLGAWLAVWGGGLAGGGGGVVAAVVASRMAANGWPSVCCA